MPLYEYKNRQSFPEEGDEYGIYHDLERNEAYIWNEKKGFHIPGGSSKKTNNEGGNQFFEWFKTTWLGRQMIRFLEWF